jgi:mannosyltransferase OCH1-like enzyme
VNDLSGPELIPRIIHQVWLGTNELPSAKMYFFGKTQKMYPDFEVKLWRESNITRDRFPLTYDVITNLV